MIPRTKDIAKFDEDNVGVLKEMMDKIHRLAVIPKEVGRPTFIVNKNGTNQTAVSTGTITDVTFGNELLDTDDVFANNKFTCKKKGRYMFSGHCQFTVSTDQMLVQCILRVNDVSKYEGEARASGTGTTGASIPEISIELEVDDEVEMAAYQDSGSDKIINGGVQVTWFKGVYLGP